MRLIGSISLVLMIAGSSAYAQSGTDVVSTSPPQFPITSSPLNGNWNLTGNRQKKQFPLLSMYLQVNGTQIIAGGDYQAVCPNSPRDGAGGIGGGNLHGEIAPDGSFTLRNGPRATIQVQVSGHVPSAGATTWSGEYTLTGDVSRKCPTYRQTNSFTATPFAPLSGTFSGLLKMKYFQSPAPAYTGPQSYQAKFSITAAQGDVVAHRLKTVDVHFYLPLTGTIHVKGSSCFSQGVADPLTYNPHELVPSRYSSISGDSVDLWFAMNDESQLHVIAVFTDPGEAALSIVNALVIGGKCDHQSFLGTLDADR
jgi:hypothetical protein